MSIRDADLTAAMFAARQRFGDPHKPLVASGVMCYMP
jgi:hypothetical protein